MSHNTLASTGPALRRRGLLFVSALALVAAAILSLTVGPFGARSASAATQPTVTIGVVDAQEGYWPILKKLVQAKLGVTLKTVNFTDYNQPNQELAEGQIDLNLFQHIEYLANYNVTNKQTLVPIGSTAVYPLTLYSTKYKTVSAIPSGSTVAVPNDSINEARGLLVLQAAGLVKLKSGGTPFSTTADVESGSKVKVAIVDAAETALQIKGGSAAAAIVNNNYAVEDKLPSTDKLYADNPASKSAFPYVNIFVSRKVDDHNKLYLQIVKLYQTKQVENEVQRESGGTAVFRNISESSLQNELALVEKQERATLK